MFKLLGTDKKEYGPVSAEQIQAWIAQGRANARTQLQAVGSTEWKALAEFPEFAAALQQSGQGAVPPAGTTGSQPASAPPKTSRLAVTSLVLGCLGLLTCGITSLVGLVLGIIALVRINQSKGQLGGQGLALAGTIISAAFLLLAPIPAALLLPALAKAKQRATGIQCMNNVKQLNLGLMMYANDNKDVFPPRHRLVRRSQTLCGRFYQRFCLSAGPTEPAVPLCRQCPAGRAQHQRDPGPGADSAGVRD